MHSNKNVDTVWEFLKPDEKTVERLVRGLGISDPLARVLANRKIAEPEIARRFLKPSLKNMESGEKLPDIDTAVGRIAAALEKNETIAVYGDYDVDGITSTSLLVNFIRTHGGKAVPYTPDRINEGYGLHTGAMEKLAAMDVGLIISVDVGVADFEAVKKAAELGMDTVIVDHHQVPDELPQAKAVVDPFRTDEAKFYLGMSAAGLTFYLVAALRADFRARGKYDGAREPNLRSELDLAALGTIADLAPLTGPNRIIAYFGLQELGAERRPGVAALKKVAGLGRRDVTAGQVAFQLAPRINAAGRVGSAGKAVTMLTTDDWNEAWEIAKELDALNRKRQEIEVKMLEEALKQVESRELHKNNAIVIGGKEWHPGVVGIVASKIAENFGLPTVVVSLNGENSKGSARSVQGLHIYRAIKKCAEFLTSFGGHEMAAGIALDEKKLEEFREKFEEVVGAAEPALRQSVLRIDADLDLEDLDGILAESLANLHPHGIGNPEPLFFSDNVKATDPRMVGNNHLKFKLKTAEGPVEAIAFEKAGLIDIVREGPVNIAYTPRLSSWEGWKRLEIKVRDIKPA